MNEINKDQLIMLGVKKALLNKSNNNIDDTLKVVSEIIDIYQEAGETQKAVNLRVLLTQLEIQNEALINRIKGIVND